MNKSILVCGAGGFIGHHRVCRLKTGRNRIHGLDPTMPRHAASEAEMFITGDLGNRAFVRRLFETRFDEVYQLAADRGGAGSRMGTDLLFVIGSRSVEEARSGLTLLTDQTNRRRAEQSGVEAVAVAAREGATWQKYPHRRLLYRLCRP